MKNDKRDDEHTHVMNKITEYILYNLLDPEREHEEVNENVVRHISQCAQCIEELDTMSTFFCDEKSSLKEKWEKLFEPIHKESICREYCSNLAEYVDDELYGLDVKEEHFSLWLHLQSCHSCNERYTTLKSMATSDLQEESVIAAAKVEQPIEGFWEKIGEKAWRFVKEIKIELQQGIVTFPNFPDFLPKPVLISYGKTRKTKGDTLSIFSFSIPIPHLDLDLRCNCSKAAENSIILTIEPMKQHTNDTAIGTAIYLKSSEGGFKGGDIRDGKKEFQIKQGIQYKIEVTYQNQKAEIPYIFSE